MFETVKLPPEWHALGREAQLAAELIAGGVTALGSASHACQGLYTQAFFGLAMGIERLAKLIIVADHAITHDGRFPDNQTLRDFGHSLARLLDTCEPVIAKYPSKDGWTRRPREAIHQGIILTLDEFATLSRYYNLDLLVGGKASRLPEPIGAWWCRVGVPILERHYGERARQRDQAQAEAIQAIMGAHAAVLHHNEEGDLISSIGALSTRAGATKVVQRYGRVYALQLVRWLVEGISAISHVGAYERQMDALMGLGEPFVLFLNDDSYFRGRKTWSIYRP
jgi:hypothetical protein